MISYELRLSAEAKHCIEGQLQWDETHEAHGGTDLANRWLDLLEKALEALARHPERNGLAPESGRWMTGVTIRQMRFKPWKTASVWRVLHAIDEPAALVTVLQIRHAKPPPLHEDEN